MVTQKEIERFYIKLSYPESGCWQWMAGLDAYDYGQFSKQRGTGQRTTKAHRWAFEHLRYTIPEGLVLDHLCSNRSCVNPWHLEPVTQAENCRRAMRTHCRRGHEYSEENTYTTPDGTKRNCRKCGAENARKYRANPPSQRTQAQPQQVSLATSATGD